MIDSQIFSAAGRVEETRPQRSTIKRFAGGCLLAFLMGFVSGCYTYSPMPAAPAPGTEVVLGLNDQGRVSLGQSVGPSAQQIEGKLESHTDSAYVVSVSSVSYFNGGMNKWSGEPLTIGRTLVSDIRERQFSRSRTFAVAAAATAALLTFVFSRSLFSNSSPERQPNGGPPDQQ
ncbi:MAG TPA: hypothetical protein VJ852_08275 [Gemmatimonadaceae bacterium]|nr:hypothetical protein [Gemmatimonadaceae bacterium]